MIVPKFWAEGRVQQSIGDRQITVRRWGWSDDSQAAAQVHADQRARAGFDRVASGAEFLRREPKVAYNGAEGVPIREEIVAQHGDTVITRNGYGALCLNTPNVLFADIDLATGAIGFLKRLFGGNPEAAARKKIQQFAQHHPDWHLRLYRTPAGFRLLALHRTFDPAEPAATELFNAIGTDPIFVKMCTRQRCFRARVSPKPWRIGIGRHYRPGVWPVTPDRQEDRRRWVAQYDTAAKGYAACQFLETLGSSRTTAEADAVRRLHDDLCAATSSKPLA